jgi:hypothetical protein
MQRRDILIILFLLQKLKPLRVLRCISLGVQSRFLLVKQPTPLSNVGLQGSLRASSLNSISSLFYLFPKERKVPDWSKLDLKDFRELRPDLLEDLPHCVGILH